MATHHVVFVLFDGVKHLDIAGPAEVLMQANTFGATYHLHYVSADDAPVSTSIGLSLAPTTPQAICPTPTTLIIPGGDHLPTTVLPETLLATTTDLAQAAPRVTSICTGSFLLAATRLLAGRRATTHWAYAGLLSQLYPEIVVSPDHIFVRDDKFLTSAGVTAGIDLALALVEEDHDATLARKVAQHLVVYLQRSGGQSQFSALLEMSKSTHESVKKVIDHVTAAPQLPHKASQLATVAGVSARHLSRLFHTELAMSPAKFVEQTRVETAKFLLQKGEPVAVAAERSGFQNPETMRRIFVNQLGLTPRSYRERFHSTLSS